TESSIHLRVEGGRAPRDFARTADQIASYTSSSIGIFRESCSILSYSSKNLLIAGKSFRALKVLTVACLDCSSDMPGRLFSLALLNSHNFCSNCDCGIEEKSAAGAATSFL
ncbi:hypothetical protein PMAYCL1PPCAC_22703, partial [Pristionchus mayeri]